MPAEDTALHLDLVQIGGMGRAFAGFVDDRLTGPRIEHGVSIRGRILRGSVFLP
jgi:hypothetical protein